MSKGRSSSMKASSRKQTVEQIQCNNNQFLVQRDKLVRSRLWLIRLQHSNWQHSVQRVCVIPLQNRFSRDLSTPQWFFPPATPLSPVPEQLLPFALLGHGTGPAVCAHPTPIPLPWAASPLHQHCSCPRATGEASRAFPDLSVHTRSHAAIRICFFPPFLYWNSVEPTLLPNKANKFNYVLMGLSEQAPTRLTGIKHLLYTMLNQNLFQFKTMCAVK